MIAILLVSPARTFLETAIAGHPDIRDMVIVRTRRELDLALSNRSYQFDLVISSLVLGDAMPIRHDADLYVQQDGLRLIRESKAGIKFVICSTHWHVRLVTQSYDDGALWYVREHDLLGDEVVAGLKRVAAGVTLEPFGVDVSMWNQWLAAHDAKLRSLSNRDLEVIEALLVDPAYSDALVERLGLANLPVAYNRVSTLAKTHGFDGKDELLEYTLAAGIRPVDRLLEAGSSLLDKPITERPAALDRNRNPQ